MSSNYTDSRHELRARQAGLVFVVQLLVAYLFGALRTLNMFGSAEARFPSATVYLAPILQVNL